MMKMKICKEMVKLRQGLDERGVKWIDKSEIYSDSEVKAMKVDPTIYRTNFMVYGVWFSVVYGYGTYGNTQGLLECVSKAAAQSGEPKGFTTANDILKVVDGLMNLEFRTKKGV